MNSKAMGATLLVSGSMVGAGMLALPLISAGLGFTNAITLLVITWACMTYTGLLALETCLNYPEGTGYAEIAKDLFGKKGQWIINLSLLLLLYSLSCAYIAGAASIYHSTLINYLHIDLSPTIIAIMFTFIIATIVFLSTKAVDITNRVLFSINIFVFIVLITTIFPSVNNQYLHEQKDSLIFAFGAIPVFCTAFGFHGIIPSLIKYLGKDNTKTLQNTIIAGGIIPIVVYLIWEVCTLGVLPRYGVHSFAEVATANTGVGGMLSEIQFNLKNQYIGYIITAFSSIALITSYLCVSLSLFDSLASTFNLANDKTGRLKSALLCYIPPLLFTIFYPNLFVTALGASAIFLVILAMIFPILAISKLRKTDCQKNYTVWINKGSLTLMMVVGVQIILDQVLTVTNQLPVFK